MLEANKRRGGNRKAHLKQNQSLVTFHAEVTIFLLFFFLFTPPFPALAFAYS